MATYIYETIPTEAGEEPQTFEFKQSMKEAPLSVHPETGKPVRRVISGGYGLMQKGGTATTTASSGGCGCSATSCCH